MECEVVVNEIMAKGDHSCCTWNDSSILSVEGIEGNLLSKDIFRLQTFSFHHTQERNEERTGDKSSDMESDWDVLDSMDLPQPDDEFCDQESQGDCDWDSGEEEEKACSDRTSDVRNVRHRFSRVYDVDYSMGRANVPKNYKPVQGSPSSCIKKNPFLLCTAIHTTRRIRMTFEDIKSEGKMVIYGSAFAISPTLACSARHCFEKQGMQLVKIDACEGSHVDPRKFDSVGFECEFLEATKEHWSKSHDRNGLNTSGADVGIFCSTTRFHSFLIPCSPGFLSAKQLKHVAIISYPGVNRILQTAKEDLKKAGTSATWRTYEPAVAKDINEGVKELAKAQKLDFDSLNPCTQRELHEIVVKKVKQVLYADLEETFGGFSSGSLLCSIGCILGSNEVVVCSSCSTLRGSSGAAVCSFDFPHYFFAIHSGGLAGFDLNAATCTDNKEFVILYMKHVLPTLPTSRSRCWKGIDLTGFLQWLKLHVKEIPKDSPWLQRVTETKSKECEECESSNRKQRVPMEQKVYNLRRRVGSS